MNYLLDTNIISELVRSKPNKKTITWIKQIPNNHLYVSVLTFGEIRKGIEVLTDYSRKTKLQLWLDVQLKNWFQQRVLPIDTAVADRWGRLWAEIKRPLSPIDSLIAATALHHDLCLVTRNTANFQFPGLELINPFL